MTLTHEFRKRTLFRFMRGRKISGFLCSVFIVSCSTFDFFVSSIVTFCIVWKPEYSCCKLETLPQEKTSFVYRKGSRKRRPWLCLGIRPPFVASQTPDTVCRNIWWFSSSSIPNCTWPIGDDYILGSQYQRFISNMSNWYAVPQSGYFGKAIYNTRYPVARTSYCRSRMVKRRVWSFRSTF